MTQTCPACGESASGRFCSNCGVSLASRIRCAQCTSEILSRDRFCSHCGAAVRPVAELVRAGMPVSRFGSASRAWLLGGVALLALLAVALLPRFRSPAAPATSFATQARSVSAMDPGSVDLSTMTPREAADRLFNRVMERASGGDSTGARAFLPMALAAYDRVAELDLDGHYHMSILHLVGDDPAAARESADVILRQIPTHLLGLHVAAQAEERMGNRDSAVSLYETLLTNYHAEIATARREYDEHRRMLPVMLEAAERAAR